jgi:hypothetical protein
MEKGAFTATFMNKIYPCSQYVFAYQMQRGRGDKNGGSVLANAMSIDGIETSQSDRASGGAGKTSYLS